MWPGFKSNVTIKKCREVVLDIDMDVQMYSLVVWGTLRIQDRGPSSRISLKTICVNVKPGGRLLAGTEDKPFSGALEMLFYGDELTESHFCGGIKGRSFDVHGEVSLYGNAPQGRMWSSLRETASAGAAKVLVMGQLDLGAGDEVLVGTTGYSGAQTERRIVSAIRYLPAPGGTSDTELVLTEALAHEHLGVSEVHGSHTLNMRAEIGLYKRKPKRMPSGEEKYSFIRISGADANYPGFRFKSMHTSKFGVLFFTYFGGKTTLRGVLVENGGSHFPSKRSSTGEPKVS